MPLVVVFGMDAQRCVLNDERFSFAHPLCVFDKVDCMHALRVFMFLPVSSFHLTVVPSLTEIQYLIDYIVSKFDANATSPATAIRCSHPSAVLRNAKNIGHVARALRDLVYVISQHQPGKLCCFVFGVFF